MRFPILSTRSTRLSFLTEPIHIEPHLLHGLSVVRRLKVNASEGFEIRMDVLLKDGCLDRLARVDTRMLKVEGLESMKLFHTIEPQEVIPCCVSIKPSTCRDHLEDFDARRTEREADDLTGLVSIPLKEVDHLLDVGSLNDAGNLAVKLCGRVLPRVSSTRSVPLVVRCDNNRRASESNCARELGYFKRCSKLEHAIIHDTPRPVSDSVRLTRQPHVSESEIILLMLLENLDVCGWDFEAALHSHASRSCLVRVVLPCGGGSHQPTRRSF